ncbi:Hypothetical predicted protein [Olea europaea subsp. europaea]|uniref:Uncharacterized protein n=1 Tax=Olea europaea subsp. europaea TaxID=158383 RepID=A0A8S0QTB8_OLEEU|nr:Hypothetical predicted protein [Olea europaea subsp. europaea]
MAMSNSDDGEDLSSPALENPPTGEDDNGGGEIGNFVAVWALDNMTKVKMLGYLLFDGLTVAKVRRKAPATSTVIKVFSSTSDTWENWREKVELF